MTPRERDLVDELFDRLARLEGSPRDPEAERLIARGLTRAPNAVYALVQTVLLQDEAAKQAQARQRDAGQRTGMEPREGSLLDEARRADTAHGSVPSVSLSKWNNGGASGGSGVTAQPATAYPQASFGQSGSFLGTAAAAALGFIGGNLLFNGLRGVTGGTQGAAFGAPYDSAIESQGPWTDASQGKLAREAGANDIGAGPASPVSRSAGLFDYPDNADQFTSDDDSSFSDSDYGGDFGDTGSSDA